MNDLRWVRFRWSAFNALRRRGWLLERTGTSGPLELVHPQGARFPIKMKGKVMIGVPKRKAADGS